MQAIEKFPLSCVRLLPGPFWHAQQKDMEATRLNLAMPAPKEFSLNVRHPAWIPAGKLTVRINGEPQAVSSLPGTYLLIRRLWQDGDEVEVGLPMRMQVEFLPGHSAWAAFVYWPIVLAAKAGESDMPDLRAGEASNTQMAKGPLYSRASAPVVLSWAGESPEDLPKPIPGRPLTFRLEGLGSPEESMRSLVLQPFHTIHDARYIIYWRVAVPGDYDAIFAALKEEEDAAMHLDAHTLDAIQLGEQQPEADHNFLRDGADFSFDGHTWRRVADWMAFDLRDPAGAATRLRISYAGTEIAGSFDVFIDGLEILTVPEGSPAKTGPHIADYPLPNMAPPDAGALRKFRIDTHNGTCTDAMYEIRLMK